MSHQVTLYPGNLTDWVMETGDDSNDETLQLINGHFQERPVEEATPEDVCCDRLFSCLAPLERLSDVVGAVVSCWTRCMGYYTGAGSN